MTTFTAEQLDAAMDVISICFFGITVLLLMIMAIKFKKISPKEPVLEIIGDFDEELVHVMKNTEKWNENVCNSNERNTRRYKRAEELADLGMSVGEISKKANIPKSEIELILRLKKIGVESRMKHRESKVDTRIK